MKKIIVLVFLFTSSTAHAGWADDKVEQILDQVQGVYNNLRDGVDQLSGTARKEIKEAVSQLTGFLNERRTLIEEFEKNQGVFKDDLGFALGAFEDLSNELLLLPSTSGNSKLIDLEKARTAVDSLPNGLMAPLWLVMEKQLMFSKSSFINDVSAAADAIHVVKPMLVPAQNFVQMDVCEYYELNREIVDDGKTKFIAAGIVMKVFGKLLVARGETKLVPEGGFWGFANASWESSPAATWGHRIEVAGDVLLNVRSSVVTITNKCDALVRHDLLVANQELIVANQEAILAMQEMFASELALMSSRLRPPAKK
jgi:hypothetical protein